MSASKFFSYTLRKPVRAFAFEFLISVSKTYTRFRTKMIFVKEKLLMDRMSDIQLRFFNIRVRSFCDEV